MTALAEVLIEERLRFQIRRSPNQHLCLLKTVMGEAVDVARGMLDKDVDVVVPSGETGSFTQTPSTSPLYSHQPAKPTHHAKSVQCKTPSCSYPFPVLVS
ncbi:hypothetical protein O5D80_001582 [Batrachochytrium dendrobatidis]|nr:hypothetical protein O5D80_001582 [Batrachochytrium dendrobatidis]